MSSASPVELERATGNRDTDAAEFLVQSRGRHIAYPRRRFSLAIHDEEFATQAVTQCFELTLQRLTQIATRLGQHAQ